MASPDMTEKDVKYYIKSILTSTPNVSTMQSLQRDYREMIGQGIPFVKLKYNSLEHFLKSIPDTCTVLGSGPFAQVNPIISAKSAHINLMVTKQKVNVKGKRKSFECRMRRSRGSFPNSSFSVPRSGGFNYSITPHNSSSSASSGSLKEKPYINPIPNRPNKEVQNVMNNSIHMANVSASAPLQVKNTNICSMRRNPNIRSKLEQDRLANQLGRLNLIEQQTELAERPVAELSRNNVEKWNNSNNQIPDNAPIEKQHIIMESNDRCQQPKNTSPAKDEFFEKSKEKINSLLTFETVKENVDEDTSNVPKRVQVNLKTLISQFDDGIWSSDLPGHYRRLFRKDLLFMDYGYTSLIDMCIDLKHIFHYVRPGKDDFKLYDRSKPLPSNVEKMYTIASYDFGGKISHDEALPELDWADFKGYIPDDVFKYGNEISKQFLPEGTKVENILDVVVVEIYDPSKFWFYLGTSDTPSLLDDLMDKIQSFYNQPETAAEYGIPRGTIKEGLYCVQVIYGEYHRARILRVLPESDQVRVLYIDYGTVCKAPIKGLCFLHSDFAVIPAQAIRCRLANIVPQLKGHPWPRSATDRFRDLVNRRDTKIKVSYIDWDEEYVCVFLADVTDSNNVLYLNETLVKEGHALWDGETQVSALVLSNFKCRVQNVHLFPTFLELEYGLAPASSEMFWLAEMLVPIQFCIPQYFEPNEQVLSDNCNDDEEFFANTFISTVKHHRKFTPWNKLDFSSAVALSTIDFDVFGNLKDDMSQFCNRLSLVGSVGTKIEETVQDEKFFCDIEDELLMTKKSCTSTARNIKDSDPVLLINRDRQLSESIIQKLERYNSLMESGNSDDFLPCLVPKVANLDLCEQYLIAEERVEHDLSTILEKSESEADSSTKEFPSFWDMNSSELNIFDNPEAFENASGSSRDYVSPITPQGFLKCIEDKLSNAKELETGSDGLGYGTIANSTSSNLEPSVNLSKLAATSPSPDVFDSLLTVQTSDMAPNIPIEGDTSSIQNLLKDLLEISEESLLKYKQEYTKNGIDETEVKASEKNLACQNEIDLPFKSSLDETRNKFISSLSLSNPFRCILENSDDHIATVRVKPGVDDTNRVTSQGGKIDINTQTDSVSLKEIQVQTSDSDESDYKVFVPKSSYCQITESNMSSSACSTPILGSNCITAQASSPPLIDTKSIIVRNTETDTKPSAPPMTNAYPMRSPPPMVATTPKMSIHAASFVPMSYQVQYRQWSNSDGYMVPQYHEWNNGHNYPGPYPHYQAPRTTVRPPPGFGPPYQGPPQCYPPAQYFVPRPSVYPQFQGVYYSHPNNMEPSARGATPVPQVPNQKDFYERFNDELLKKLKEKP